MAAAAPPWPVVQDESWQCAKTPTLPFLGFHEHTALRPIGEVTISMPASPFFSLFLADDVKPGERARHDGGQSSVVFGKWSKHGASRERRVQYACDGVAIREAQRCTFVKDDGLVLEARCWAAANPGAARSAASQAELGEVAGRDDDEWNLCERWVVAETTGYLRSSTTVTAWASSEAGRKRWRAWASVLERRTYAAAVWAMASDSLFRSSTAPATGAAGPFSARAPPDRVQRAVLTAPPAVSARRRLEAERAATESAAAAGLGRLQAPWAVASPTVEADAPRRVVTVRAPGETYDVVVQTKDIGLQFSSVTNGCVVDGVDGYASADPPPSLGSRLVAVDGVRVGGLAFAGAAALLNREARPLRLAFCSPAPDSLADALLAADDAASSERAVAAALDKAKALRKRLDGFGESFSKSDLTDDAPRRFWGTCRGAVRSLREAKLLKPLQRDDGVLKNLREKEEEEDDDEFWERCEAAVERRLMPSCVDALLNLSPGGDDELAVTLGRLRFLRLEHLGVSAPGEADNDIGGEWAVAVEELRATDDAQSVSEVLDRVAQCCRFAAAAAEKVRNKGRRLEAYENVGADDVVPSLTYVAIRANPKRLATTLWFVETYASSYQLRGERGYAAASLRVAVDFASQQLRSAEPLEGLISDEAFKSGVRAAALVDEACAAAQRGDAKAFRLLLAAGVDVTAPDARCMTSPLIAVIEGQVCVDEVLARVAPGEVDAVLRDGRTALMASAAVGAAGVCAALLRKGADASKRDAHGRTALMVARHRATRVLLSCGPPTDEAVVAAALKADVDVLRALLAKGGNAKATDGKGCPALVAACAATAPACVAALLDSDADPNATHEGATALAWCVGLRGRATASNQAACAALLLNRGADRRDAPAWCGDCGSSQLRAALETPETALRDGAVVLAAVEKDDGDLIGALLAQNWPADASTKEGDLALHVAADRGHVAAARALLDGGAAVDAPGGDGATPLMRATAAAQPDVVALLLNRGASVQLRDAAGRRASETILSKDRKRLLALLASDPVKRPLVILAARDDAAGVRALLTRGADVNERSRCQTREAYHPELWTPLIAACAYDAKDAAKLLLAAPGIELDATNPYGLTALHYAAIRGSASMLLALLGAGAERHARDRAFRTPLDWARRRLALDADVPHSNWAADLADGLAAPVLQFDPTVDDARQLASIGDEKGVVALLLQGVSLNGVDNGSTHGATILLAACAAGKLSVVKRLLAHPEIDVNLGDRRGVLPLMQSAASGFDDGVLALLAAGARRDATCHERCHKGRAAKDYAAARGHVALGALLAADPDAISIFDVAGRGHVLALDGLLRQRPKLLHARRARDRATPLHVAAAAGNLEAVKALLKRKGRVDVVDSNGATPLMHAAGAGAIDVCTRLVKSGADASRRDAAGRTASSWASKKSYGTMMRFLAAMAVS